MADNTTSDLGLRMWILQDVTSKNLDTEKGGYYVSLSRETRMKFEDGLVHGASASEPTDNITIYVALRIRTKARSATLVWLHHNGLERGPDGDDHGVADNLSDGRPVLRDPSDGGQHDVGLVIAVCGSCKM